MKKIFLFNSIVILISFICKAQSDVPLKADSSFVKTDRQTIISNVSAISFIKVDTTVKKLVEKDYNVIINLKLNRWVSYYKNLCSNFNINDYAHCETWFLNPYQINMNDYREPKKFVQLYKPYLIWNSDSTKALDLYSNDIILEMDSLGNTIANHDVDPHFALIDFKNNKRIVLWQMGAISNFDDAFWLDENHVIITTRFGNFKNNNKQGVSFDLFYYLVNLKTFQIDTYCTKKSFRAHDAAYLGLIFK